MILQINNISFDSILWFCAAGKSFFLGISLLIVSALLSFMKRKPVAKYIVLLFSVCGLLAIVLSATPMNIFLLLIWLTLFILTLLCQKRKAIYFGLFVFVSLFIVALEMPYHQTKMFSIESYKAIYVIGDSVSAGMGNKDEKTWPVLLSEELDIPVINLSIAGATVHSALKQQAPKVTGENNLIFLEIGGNDLLNFNSPKDYEESLTELIQCLDTSSNKILWFELPLLPQYYSYGKIQRKLAKQLNIDLIPKFVLATAFNSKDATLDGIHLTPKGHEIMKQQIQKLIQRERRLP